ncbi:MAG TPA: transposase [Fimbriimonadaceae bacterium]
MEITRSTKCSFKFATAAKAAELRRILDEYAVVVNFFIKKFWDHCPSKSRLLKTIVNTPDTWLDYTLRQTAAREAVDMITASKTRHGARAIVPEHKAKSMRVSTGTAQLLQAKTASIFNLWLSVKVGNKDKAHRISIQLPVLPHKHMQKLASRGKMCGSFTITDHSVQLAYKIDIGNPRPVSKAIGVDTGIKALASLSTGEQYGREMESMIQRVRRRKQGSKGQQRARRSMKQFIDRIAKRIAAKPVDLIVAEDLTGISHNTKARLGKRMRATIGNWNQRYWLGRLEMACEMNRVQFHVVPPAYTSQTCHQCGHVDRSNRNGEAFCCKKCGHACNADINAARNILSRFESGVKGPACKGVNFSGYCPVST